MYVILGTKVTGSIFIRWNMAFFKKEKSCVKKNKEKQKNKKTR